MPNPDPARRRRIVRHLVIGTAVVVSAACSVTTPREEQVSAGALGDGVSSIGPGSAGETGPAEAVVGEPAPSDSTATPTDGNGVTQTTTSGIVPSAGSTASGTGRRTASGSSGSAATVTTGPAGAPVTATTLAAGGGAAPGAATTSTTARRAGQAATPAPAPGAPAEVGVTADSIVVSAIAGFGGQFGALEEGWFDGFMTWADDVNSRGGIHGRKVVIKKVDHKETVDGGIAACKESLSNGSFTAYSLIGIDANTASTDCLDQAGVPNLYYSNITPISSKWKRSYSTVVPFDQQGKALASFVKNKLGAGNKKLGVIYLKEPSFRVPAEAYIAEAKRLGMNVVRAEPVELNQASFVSEARRMQQAGVENLAMIVTSEAIGIVRDARVVGWSPQFTGFQFTLDSFSKAAKELFDGIAGLKWTAPIDSPRYAEFKAKSNKFGRNGRVSSQDDFAFMFYGQGLALGRVLEAAGPNPSRKTLGPAIESIRGFETGILAPLSWGPGQLLGTMAAFPVVCCNSDSTWKSLGPPAAEF